MTDIAERDFFTGEPIWVTARDGSRRPAEYLGQGLAPRSTHAFVIYVDEPDGDVVQLDSLLRRDQQR